MKDPSRQFLACDVVSTWIWGWNHVATSPNLNTTSYRRRISDVVLTRKNDIITTSYRRHAWNDVEIRYKSRCNCVEITLKLWRWNKFHLKFFSTSFQRQFAIFQRRFYVETTSLCLLGYWVVGCWRVLIPFLKTSFIQASGPVFSYNLRYIVGFGLVEMAISTNSKPTIYRNLYENSYLS